MRCNAISAAQITVISSALVQITDFGMVIDELDLYMTDDNKISAVSKLLSNGLMKDADSPMKYSKHPCNH